MNEPAAAVTDVALGLAALAAFVGLRDQERVHRYWLWSFGLIGVAGLSGGVYHGFLKSHEAIGYASWATISFVVAVALSFILAATAAIVLGEGRGRLFLAVRLVGLAAFLIVAILGRAAIPTLMLTEGLGMLMVLGLWLHAWRLRQPTAGMVLAAIAASGLAGAARIGSLNLTLAGGVELEKDALYHLAQIPGILLLYLAVRRRSQPAESAFPVVQPSL